MPRRVHCKSGQPFDVYVGRPSPFGNPYTHKDNTLAEFKVTTRDEAVDAFEAWVMTQPALLEKIRTELKGKILACWCREEDRCHADVLLKVANPDPRENAEYY